MALIQGEERIIPRIPEPGTAWGTPLSAPHRRGPYLTPYQQGDSHSGEGGDTREKQVLLPCEPPTHPVSRSATINTSIYWVRG